jgi:hypothetical protein
MTGVWACCGMRMSMCRDALKLGMEVYMARVNNILCHIDPLAHVVE